MVQSVSGALAERERAAVLLLQRDAAVPPRRAQVQVRGDDASVKRRVGEEDDGQSREAVWDESQTEQEKHLLLETSPLSQEGGVRLVVRHAAVFGGAGAAATCWTQSGLGELTVVISVGATTSSHPPPADRTGP